MTEPRVELPQNADELLRDFPLREPDFEAQARAIEARLGEAPAPGALSNDALFEAPELADAAPPPSARERTKGHLAELARRSLQQPKDDGAALAKELLAAAKERKHDAALVERVRAAGKAAPTATPLPLSEPRDERRSGVVNRAEAPPSPSGTASDKRGVVIALIGIAVAAAAAFALFAGAKAPSTPPTTEATRAPTAAIAAAPEAQPERALPAVTPPSGGAVLSPEALPAATVADASAAAGKAPLKGAPKALPASPTASAAPVEVVQLSEDPPAAAAKAAEPPPPEEEPLRPAEGNAGNVPLSPSSGAVSTALGSVRGGAQACLAGQTESVTATITFASDGRVLRVSAGGPSGGCIQAALSKARISPFAKDSFSATTTIRPP